MEIFKLFGSIFIDNEPANRKLDETDTRAQRVGNTLANTAKTAAKWGAAIAAGATAAGTAMFALVNRVTNVGAEIDAKRKMLGITSEALQEYRYAADQVGVPLDAMERALGRLNQRIGMAERGNQKYAESLRELNVTSKDAAEAFVQAIEALHQMPDANARAAAAADLFGTQLARQLMPIIEEGGESLIALRNRAHELGLVMSQDMTAASNNFQSALADIRGTINNIAQDVVARVLPTFERWAIWTADNIPKVWAVFQFVGEVIEIVFRYMRLIIGDGIAWMRENAIEPFVNWLARVWEERGPPIVAAVEAFWDGVKAVFGAVFDVLRGLWDAFILAFQGDWQGAWERVKETATNLWNALPELFTGIMNPLIDIADNIMTAVIDVIRAVFGDDVAGLFQQAWDTVVVVFEAARDILLGVWTALTAAFRGDWEGAWNAIRGVIETAWEAIETVVETALNIIRTTIDAALNGIVALIRWAFGDEAAETVDDAFQVIRDIVDGLTDVILGIVRTFAALFRGDWQAAWDEAKGVVSRAWDVIETTVQSALDLIAAIIDGAMNGIVALIRWAFGDETADVVDNLFDAVRLIVDTGSEAIMGIIRALTAAFRGDWEAAWQEIRDVAIGIWNALPEIFEQSLDGIVGIADSIMQAVIGVIRQLFGDEIADSMSGIWDTILDVLDVFRDAFLGVWRALTAAFSGDWSTAWDEVVGVVTRVWNAIPGIVEGALNGVFGIVDTVITSIIGLIERLFGEQVADVFQRGWDTVTIVFETARDTLLGILDVLSSLLVGDWEEAWQGVLDVLTRIWDGVLDIIAGPLDGVVDWVSSWVLTIHGLFTAMRDTVTAAVRNTAEGIVEWFSETKLGQTFSWIGEQVRGVTGWFYDMYDKVVGNSYVPDMVEEIGEAIERLKDRLANPVARYTASVIESFEHMEDEVVASMMSMAEAMDKVLDDMVNRVSRLISDVTRQFFHGTAAWADVLNSFANAIGGIFGSIFDAIAKELVKNILTQNTWLVQTLSNIATAITGFLSQAYATLVAFFAWSGPAAPVLAGGVIAAAIAAIASLGGSIIRGMLPDAPGTSPGGAGPTAGNRTPSGGRQVSEITGPTRDLLTDLLTPLTSLNTLTGIGERIYALLDERMPMPGMALAGAGGGGVISGVNVTIERGAVQVTQAGWGVTEITDDVIEEIAQRLAELITFQLRGTGR